jgi:AcrR family transcriptional regulator
VLEKTGSGGVEEITVKELCENAAVNRTTFYTHFEDIYDLMNEVQEDLKEEILQYIKANMPGSTENRRDALIKYLRLMREKQKIYFRLVDVKGPDGLREQTWRASKEIFLGKSSGNAVADLKDEFLLAYKTYGITAIIERWMLMDAPIPESDLADLLLEHCI